MAVARRRVDINEGRAALEAWQSAVGPRAVHGQRQRTVAQPGHAQAEIHGLAHARDGAEVALQVHDGQAGAVLRHHVGIGHAQGAVEPVLDQAVEQHQVLRKEDDARGVAVREAYGHLADEARRGGCLCHGRPFTARAA